MERIKEALQKARNQRPESDNPPNPAKPDSKSPEQKTQKSDSLNISYDQTKVITLDQDLLDRHRIVAKNKGDPNGLLFDILRTQVLSKMQENGWKTLAITSPVPACGKTMVSINLGISIAHHTNKTAVLVDFDLRRPAVAKYLGIPATKSFNDFIEEKATISEVMVNPGISRFVVLPTTRPFKYPAEILASNKVQGLIDDLKHRYEERIVIFDLPPVLSADDVMTILPKVDCVLLVVGNGMVSKSELEDTMRHLRGTNLIGTVLNKAEVTPNNYYY